MLSVYRDESSQGGFPMEDTAIIDLYWQRSDQAISEALQAQGIRVARRTVAKYREEELKILPARYRKQV